MNIHEDEETVVAFRAQLLPGKGGNGTSEVVDAVTEGVERIED